MVDGDGATFSVGIHFKRDVLYSEFVKDVYDIFFQSGFPYKSGFWIYEDDMTLEQIIEWNQKHLEDKFVLGFDQHYKYDCRQILLDTDLYEEMRLFWMYLKEDDIIFLHLVVPEENILHPEMEYCCLQEKINPLILLSCKLWDTGKVAMIQSSLELDDTILNQAELEQGRLPTMHPFCIVDSELARKICSGRDFTSENLDHNGVLIIDNSFII